MPYGSKLHVAPTSYHLLDAQRKHPIEKYSRRFFGRKKSKNPMRTNSSQHYGHLCVYGLLKKKKKKIFFFFFLSFFFFLLLSFLMQTPHPSAHPTPKRQRDCGHSTEKREEWEGKENVNFCDSTTFQHKVLNASYQSQICSYSTTLKSTKTHIWPIYGAEPG